MNPKARHDAIDRLLTRFLDRESAATRRSYADSIADYAKFARAKSPASAVRELLEMDVVAAEQKLERYKRSLIGVRDSKGKLIRGRGLSAASVNLRLTAVRALVKQAFRTKLVSWEITVRGMRAELVKDVRGPGDQVLSQMLVIAKDQQGAQAVRDYAIMRLFAELGLRRREILALDMDDVDVEACEIRVLGKGRRERQLVHCTPKTAEALVKWITVRPQPRDGSPFFTNLIPGRASRISGSALYLIVRKLGAKALPKGSRKKVSPHRVRHTAITAAVRGARAVGLSREEVRRFSRHADLRMLDRYIDEDDRAQALLANAIGKDLP